MKNRINHYTKFKKAIRSIVVLFCVSFVFSTLYVPHSTTYALDRYENIQIFGATPSGDDRQVGDCFAGLFDFLYVTIGNGFNTPGSDFVDYWRDFFLAPSHFNDVFGVQLQLNKARNAVIGTFLRCDVSRFKQVTAEYYKLEAELYFVRHFVDTASLFGTPTYNDRVTIDATRRTFSNEVVDFVMSKTPNGNRTEEDQKHAVYSGHFDLFVAKYRHKVERYKKDSSESDDATKDLKEKIEKLGDTIMSFQKVTDEMAALGNDVGKTAMAAKEAFVPDHSSASSVFYGLISGAASRFDACASTDDERYCASDAIKYLNKNDIVQQSAEQRERDKFKTSSSQPKSFGDVIFAVEEEQRDDMEDMDEGELLTRYEILYGRVGGSGITAMVNEVDKLYNTLKFTSIKPLNQVYECADFIEDKQCK